MLETKSSNLFPATRLPICPQLGRLRRIYLENQARSDDSRKRNSLELENYTMLTVTQLAAALGYKPRTIHRWIHRGLIRAESSGHQFRVSLEEVARVRALMAKGRFA